MKENKLFLLLKSLSIWELKAFDKYVASPFFNVNQDVTKLYEIISKHYPEFEHTDLSLEALNKQLFPRENGKLQKLRYVMTDLTRLAEGFLIQISLSENHAENKKLLLKKLHERNIDKFFRQHLSDSFDSYTSSVTGEVQHLKHKFDFNELAYEFQVAKDNRAIDDRLQQLSDHLDQYYLAKKLKYSCEMLNRQNILNVKYDTALLDHLLTWIEKQKFTEPLISIYYTILLTIMHDSQEQHYKKLKKLLQDHQAGFSLKELRDIYAFAQNYCIRKVNTGKTNYVKELFDLYNFQLEKKIIFDNDQLGHADFKNIVAIALRLEEFTWTEDFISRYSRFLPTALRKNSINYNLARLHFSRRQHKQAVRLLTAVEFTDVYYHLDSKALLLKVYYETEDFEPLFSLVSTFKAYLRRSKLISSYQRNSYHNLLKFVMSLSQIRAGENKSLEKVKAAIAHEPQIADIGWLQSKLAELDSSL